MKQCLESSYIAAISIIFATTTILSCIHNNTNENIYDLISTKGIKYTTEYISNHEKRYKHSYGKAWLRFNEGNIQESKDLIKYLLNEQPDTKLLGNCFYLNGYISLYELNRHDAIKEFEKSISEYEKISAYLNMFYSYLGIAVAHMDSGDMNSAKQALHEAITNFKVATNWENFSIDNADLSSKHHRGLAEYYLVRKRYDLMNGDMDQALINSANSLIFYRAVGSVTGEANALSDLGFIYMLTGDYNHGWEYTIKAQGLIIKLDDEKKFIYNQLNILIYLRCHGMDYQYLIEDIESWIVQYHDNKLHEYLKKVLALSCD